MLYTSRAKSSDESADDSESTVFEKQNPPHPAPATLDGKKLDMTITLKTGTTDQTHSRQRTTYCKP